jgi:HAMP domain-containing protein
MTAKDAVDLLQSGGVLAAAMLALWAILTGKVITRREFDRELAAGAAREATLQKRLDEIDELNKTANAELRQQSATNAKLVELSFKQRQEAENIRTGPQPHNRRASDRAD